MAQQKIWVVDDDAVNAMIVSSALGQKGHDVEHVASSAADAIAKINTVSAITPDKPLILTDNDMEHKNAGMEVIKAAKAKGLNVVMMSAEPSAESEARKHGANDFWEKSTADLSGLTAKIDAAIAPSQGRAP